MSPDVWTVMNNIEDFRNWCVGERRSIQKIREFWAEDGKTDMVHYESARLDELNRVIQFIEEMENNDD